MGTEGIAKDLAAALNVQLVSASISVQLTSVAGTLYGYSIHESATTAARALVTLRDGTNDSAGILAVIELDPTEATTIWFGPQGINVLSGIRATRTVGTTEGVVFYGV